jgi:hypothetical protein
MPKRKYRRGVEDAERLLEVLDSDHIRNPEKDSKPTVKEKEDEDHSRSEYEQ